jgi:hypothetical protein
LLSFSVTLAQGWYDANWLYRKAITLDPANGGNDLTNFPVLIDITDAELGGAALTNGGDILFTSDNGTTKLDHEIVSYANSTGDLVAWVKVPILSSGGTTVVYMYYGTSTTPPDQENAAGVWDANYVMVQHLDEDTGTHEDSTAYGNNSNDVVVANQAATGSIDGADDFNGSTNYVRVPDNIDSSLQFGEGSFTAEAWIYPHSVPDSGGARIVNNRGTGAGGSYPGWHLKIKNQVGNWLFSDSGIDDNSSNYKPYVGTPTYGYNQWYQVVMVYEADTEMRFYVNGVEDGTLTVGAYGSISNSLPTVIGASLAANGVEGTTSQFFDGIIDEVRLSNIDRTADWILTSYTNQVDPASFSSIGLEEPQCTLDTDCDDSNVCTDDSCVAGTCSYANNTAPCDDSDACTTSDTCSGGICVGGSPLNCDDADVCTDDSCNPATGCVYANNTAPCDDSDACTTSDTCSGGICVGGSPLNCDDADVCTDDSCNPATGCVYTNNTAPCDDSDACTTSDTCSGGICAGGGAPNCDDGNVCTDDSCDSVTGCLNAPNTANCNDGLFCNGPDTCSGGSCSLHTGDPCGGLACDDVNDLCEGSDVTLIVADAYGYSGTIAIELDNPSDFIEEVHTDICDIVQRTWLYIDTINCFTTIRSSGLSCAISDLGGGCVRVDLTYVSDWIYPGAGAIAELNYTIDAGAPLGEFADLNPQNITALDINSLPLSITPQGGNVGAVECVVSLDCDDNNVCTDDSCVGNVCQYSNNTLSCEDGDLCTESDLCINGVCVSGPAPDCDDGNICTDDSCDSVSGCVNAPNSAPCDDGDACTTNDTCASAACVGGAAANCDDGNACTDDSCDSATGCVNTPNSGPCDDGLWCTANDVCSSGTCGGTLRNCSALDDQCNDGVCDENIDLCVKQLKLNGTPCEDGQFCTEPDTCFNGICTAGPARDCSGAGDDCNDVACDENVDQCVLQPRADGTVCDDGFFCTQVDECQGGQCLGITDPCTDNGEYCDGLEYCDEGNDICDNTGDPCGGLTCDDVNDLCEGSDVTLIVADAYGYSGTIAIELDNPSDFIEEVSVDICDADLRYWLNIDTASCSTTILSSGLSCADLSVYWSDC